MKWKAFARRRSPGDGVHAELQRIPGRVPDRSRRVGHRKVRARDRRGRLAQQRVFRPAERRRVALLRLHDRHDRERRDQITPYVDGRAVSYTKTESGTGAGTFAKATLYWMSRDASTLFGAGSMQDLALYDTTLSSSTIAEHYELGEGGPKAAFTSSPVVATAGVARALRCVGLLLADGLDHRLCVGFQRQRNLLDRWGRIGDDLAYVLLAGDLYGRSARERQSRRDRHGQPHDHGRRRARPV